MPIFWRLNKESVIERDGKWYFSEDEVMLLVENIANYIAQDESFYAKKEAERQLELLKTEVILYGELPESGNGSVC